MPAIVARFWRVLVLLVAALVSSAAWAATPAGTVITNTVQASWQSGAVPQTVSASRTITVSAYTAGPDMKLVMAGPAQALPGSTMIWKLLVTDLGPTPGSGAQVAITVPPGVTAISAVCAVLNSATCGVVNVGAPTVAISDDGRFAAFVSNDNLRTTSLVPGAVSGQQVFFRDRQAGTFGLPGRSCARASRTATSGPQG